MTSFPCASCSDGPTGEGGHPGLTLYVGGPYPGQHIFKCGRCDERWIRRYGNAEVRYAWARFSQQFATRRPRIDPGTEAFI